MAKIKLVSTPTSLLALRFTIGPTPEELPNKPLLNSLRIRAPVGNVGAIFIAKSRGNVGNPATRYSLPPGGFDDIRVDNLSQIWIFGTVGDFLDLIATELVKE